MNIELSDLFGKDPKTLRNVVVGVVAATVGECVSWMGYSPFFKQPFPESVGQEVAKNVYLKLTGSIKVRGKH